MKRVILSPIILATVLFFALMCEYNASSKSHYIQQLLITEQYERAFEEWNSFYKDRYINTDKNLCFAIDAAMTQCAFADSSEDKAIHRETALHLFEIYDFSRKIDYRNLF